MNTIARNFLSAAVIYGLIGLALGLHMAISQDHGQMPTHAHIQVIGWVSFFLFATYYQVFGTGSSGMLAKVHFWLAQISMLGIMIGLWLIYSGRTELEPIAAVSSLAYAASFLLFAYIVFTGSRKTG